VICIIETFESIVMHGRTGEGQDESRPGLFHSAILKFAWRISVKPQNLKVAVVPSGYRSWYLPHTNQTYYHCASLLVRNVELSLMEM
jgi:hypothetical protein